MLFCFRKADGWVLEEPVSEVISIYCSSEDFTWSMCTVEKIAELFSFLSTACCRGNHKDFLVLTAVMMCCAVELPGLPYMNQLLEFNGPPA